MSEPDHVARMREFIRRNRWTFAKTMPTAPHEYVVRQKVADDAGFDHFVTAIRRFGEPRRWGGRTYVYFRLDGHDYWTMGAPVDKTTIINRAVPAQRERE